MPRPERPLDPSAGPIAAFAADLRSLRNRAGTPKYLQMARSSGRSRTALAEAAGGYHVPTWATTEAFVRACGGDVQLWRRKWQDLQRATGSATESTPAPDRIAGAGTDSDQPAVLMAPPGRTRHEVDVLLRMWQEQRTQARQSENQRALVTCLVVLFALLTVAVLLLSSQSYGVRLCMAVGLAADGVFGAIITAKYYERFAMHMDAAQRLRRRLDESLPERFLETDWQGNRDQHSRNFRVLYRTKLHHLWLLIHLGIAVAGIGAATAAIVGWAAQP